MKKYIATAALCLATVLPTFAQTRRVMTVHQKDGTTKVYKVNSIKNVTFTDETLATLSNQWAYNDDVKDLSKVTMLDANGSYEFALYGSDNDTKPVFELTIPQSLMGKNIMLGSDDAQDVKVAYNGETPKLTGTLQAKFDKFKKNVTITLEAETADYSDLRCKWTNSAFTQIYTATNSIKTTNVNDVKTYDIASALVLNPATVGAATTFAFGDVEATTADGLLAGKIGVAVSISASKLYNGTIDLAADADSYTLKYIDYATRVTYEKVKAGTITTAKDKDGKLYIKINATFDDNRTIELEYYGATTAVESLEGMTPAVVSNSYKLYNPDRSILINQDICKVLFKQKNNIYTFYLYGGEFSSKYSGEKVTLQVDESFINAGTINLAELKDGDNFQVKYSDVQLYSPDAKYGGFNNTPDNGTLSIKKDAAGNYEISLDVVNTYTNKNTPNGAGNKERLVFNYSGEVGAY